MLQNAEGWRLMFNLSCSSTLHITLLLKERLDSSRTRVIYFFNNSYTDLFTFCNASLEGLGRVFANDIACFNLLKKKRDKWTEGEMQWSEALSRTGDKTGCATFKCRGSGTSQASRTELQEQTREETLQCR